MNCVFDPCADVEATGGEGETTPCSVFICTPDETNGKSAAIGVGGRAAGILEDDEVVSTVPVGRLVAMSPTNLALSLSFFYVSYF